MEKLEIIKQDIQNAINGLDVPKFIKHVCICKASFLSIERDKELPSFLRSTKHQRLWLMPESHVPFNLKNKIEDLCKIINERLGGSYDVSFFPLNSDIVMGDPDFVINL